MGADTESAPVNREGFTAQPYAETTIAADGTTVVTISYLRNTQYLNYQTSGGSYVARQDGKYGATVDVTDEQPVRNGFSFEGWYLDEGLNTPAGRHGHAERRCDPVRQMGRRRSGLYGHLLAGKCR